MNKKIFKALGVGLKGFVEENKEILSFWTLATVLTVLSVVAMKILGITPSMGITILIAFAVLIGSAWIIGLITHCTEAVKYSEEHKCNMKEAWNKTASDFGCDDDF